MLFYLSFEQKVKMFKALEKILNKDGKILVAYLYGTSHNDMLTRFATDNIIEDARYINFKGVRGIYKNTNDVDTAVIYKKSL